MIKHICKQMHNMRAAYQCLTNEVHHVINQDIYKSEAAVVATSLSVDLVLYTQSCK